MRFSKFTPRERDAVVAYIRRARNDAVVRADEPSRSNPVTSIWSLATRGRPAPSSPDGASSLAALGALAYQIFTRFSGAR